MSSEMFPNLIWKYMEMMRTSSDRLYRQYCHCGSLQHKLTHHLIRSLKTKGILRCGVTHICGRCSGYLLSTLETNCVFYTASSILYKIPSRHLMMSSQQKGRPAHGNRCSPSKRLLPSDQSSAKESRSAAFFALPSCKASPEAGNLGRGCG